MKVLITGGCGFLGSNIAKAFLREDVEVFVVDAMTRKGADANLSWLRGQAKPAQLTHYLIDLANWESVEACFKAIGQVDYVCHLAGQVAMTTSLTDPRRDFLTNALGTLHILEAVRRFSPEAFIAYSSTNKVYGDLAYLEYREEATRYVVPQFPHGFDESLPLDFASPYGCSKGAADQYVRDWFRNYQVKTVVFRHSSIYGGRQFSTFDQGWIGWFCQKALEQKQARLSGNQASPFTIAGTGKQVRDVLHAEDLVRLYLRAYEKRNEVAGEIFNIGGGMSNSLSLLELFAMLEKLLGLSDPLCFERQARRQSDQDFFVADLAKVRRMLNWQPLVRAQDGIEMMLDWLSSQEGGSSSPVN